MTLDLIMGFRDLNKYFIQYPNPTNNLELALNAHSKEDELVQQQREIFANLRKLTTHYPQPLYRYWVMTSFVLSLNY
jgi:hypothetical protein